MSGERTTTVIDHAILEWGASDELAPHSSIQPDCAPRSPIFDDVYFSGDGPAETNYVFLRGNNLPARFEHTAQFQIGELGFGTGLNFLVAWDRWEKAHKPENATLHFFSVEGFPLAPDDMERAHAAWPDLGERAGVLRSKLPPPLPGFHHIAIGDHVTLTLFYGDALEGLGRANANINAWFFDGFAPSKNPAMWSAKIFNEVARLSADKASFATFTVAGMVRRNLESAGFAWQKTPGHGRKKEMLVGALNKADRISKSAPWHRRAGPINPRASVAIIGAGVAGASLAYELTRAGFRPTLFEATAPASGASGNMAGLIMPRLDVGDYPAGRFHISAYIHSLRLIGAMNTPGLFNPCGAKLHATNDRERERHQKLINQKILPNGWIEPHADGLFFPQAGVINPSRLVECLIGGTDVITARVSRLDQAEQGWLVSTENQTHEFDAVIIANGLDALRFTQARGLPITGSAGQIDYFPDAPPPDHIHVTGPYCAPSPDAGADGGLVIGATYLPIDLGHHAKTSKDQTDANIASVAQSLPDLVRNLNTPVSRASVRCTTPDQLPIAGPVPDWGFYAGAYDGLRHGRREAFPDGQMRPNLYILTALGSRGLVTAPYVAAMITADLAGTPAPADHEVYEALHPARFFIRDLKRGYAKPVSAPACE
ncbi:bifunctional tRNA (5-methylaminomethyl-2-thiouridine)(34)-methyltransferase MnmD/FAD-dependent 5-carboxymethylaminomethyl-2-thiouridine(34) oxidoreductase MnmC [Hyphococcus formosus]|uniref:bifunctional tRNA (5-methylaminomethyl-2-thiouridine)(34)-methyltransferase MnmD/FAD-dependent 5-carboxymethylaminomethyl-2-thiouridine(34) oxidoreductase MnmC n=1 Tax=Hyphococcus formosus TaxID=3143534 RepID=UPI00398BA7FC